LAHAGRVGQGRGVGEAGSGVGDGGGDTVGVCVSCGAEVGGTGVAVGRAVDVGVGSVWGFKNLYSHAKRIPPTINGNSI